MPPRLRGGGEQATSGAPDAGKVDSSSVMMCYDTVPIEPEGTAVAAPTEADAESIDVREAPAADQEKPLPPRMCYKTVRMELDG